MIFLNILFVLFFELRGTLAQISAQSVYENNILFYGYNSNNPTQNFISNSTTDIDTQCDPNGKFAIIVPGWTDDINVPYVPELIQNLLKYRGGCVLFMDYYFYAKMEYKPLRSHFRGISAVLLKKIKQIKRYDQQYLIGLSFGSRLCQDAGLKLGYQLISRMDLCDPIAPAFNNYQDPKPAAKNVACIATSGFPGTQVYNCHQNFRMGKCGLFQPGTNVSISHQLCSSFLNSAFTHDFVSNNLHNCFSSHPMNVTASECSNVKMGYNADFDRVVCRGDVFIATAKYYPYVVVDGVVDNTP